MTIITDASAAGFTWTKASYSGNQGDCLEVAHGALPAALPVRDSERPAGPAVVFGGTTWGTFVDAVKTGDLAPRTTQRASAGHPAGLCMPPDARRTLLDEWAYARTDVAGQAVGGAA
ncbi:DUF397 domain-containing protein [Streptomyces turgidiscabies]|uniref:DUF397 domain-containing protein n=1 Tax=Streptomyces turgidiscabies TaxID=85558 RepID=A0ABU0RVL5_9ACTN|nr:DUF397 domain-containing protein [Streptomyces turgidiscabies]MDQ0936006.1 hypothetical protein [Streptomyces turgidiscabies]